MGGTQRPGDYWRESIKSIGTEEKKVISLPRWDGFRVGMTSSLRDLAHPSRAVLSTWKRTGELLRLVTYAAGFLVPPSARSYSAIGDLVGRKYTFLSRSYSWAAQRSWSAVCRPQDIGLGGAGPCSCCCGFVQWPGLGGE